MSKKYQYPLIALTLFMLIATIAGRKPPKRPQIQTAGVGYSWFGTYGMQRYDRVNGALFAAEMSFPLSQIGFYTQAGNAFVGESPALTHISGTCQRIDYVNMQFTGLITIDNNYSMYLFDTMEKAAVFDLTAYGQSFVIKIWTIAPLGCNILMQTVP